MINSNEKETIKKIQQRISDIIKKTDLNFSSGLIRTGLEIQIGVKYLSILRRQGTISNYSLEVHVPAWNVKKLWIDLQIDLNTRVFPKFLILFYEDCIIADEHEKNYERAMRIIS